MGNEMSLEEAPLTENPYHRPRFYLSRDGNIDDFGDENGNEKAFSSPAPSQTIAIPNYLPYENSWTVIDGIQCSKKL